MDKIKKRKKQQKQNNSRSKTICRFLRKRNVQKNENSLPLRGELPSHTSPSPFSHHHDEEMPKSFEASLNPLKQNERI